MRQRPSVSGAFFREAIRTPILIAAQQNFRKCPPHVKFRQSGSTIESPEPGGSIIIAQLPITSNLTPSRPYMAEGFTRRRKRPMLDAGDLPSDRPICPRFLKGPCGRISRLLQALLMQ